MRCSRVPAVAAAQGPIRTAVPSTLGVNPAASASPLQQQPPYQTVPGKIIVKLRDDYLQVGLAVRRQSLPQARSCRASFR